MKLFDNKPKVEGYIAFYGLQDWWFSAFTKDERDYMDNRYQPPMNPQPHPLTCGKIQSSSQPASSFVSTLGTWFESSKDASIAERIHEKVIELGRLQPIQGPGYYDGRHFTTYVYDVKRLKKAGDLENTERLLLELVAATEAESVTKRPSIPGFLGMSDTPGVAPWYYEELAKIYRKQKEYSNEVAILERFAKQKHAPGVSPPRLLERLEKAKALMAKTPTEKPQERNK